MLVTLYKGRLLLVVFVSFLIWIVIKEYLFCPTFSFKIQKPFSGKFFYNPYDSIDPGHWVKCNFHAHTNAWHGLTHGSGTAKDVYRAYDSMHYGIHCVSDYQFINTTYGGTPGYIPAYEHGYNVGKTHQLLLGSSQVKWIDYLLPQTLDNKQDILNALSGPDNVVVVNHPLSFHGYNASDFKYLSNYNCMEVLSPYAISIACWDAALSNGKAVFIVGNDDEHNIYSKNSIAKMCTCINVNAIRQKTVLNALKRGESYGVILGNCSKQLPTLKRLRVSGDTMMLEMSDTANQISFIGQNGKLLQTSGHVSCADYIIKPRDHYVRAVIDYPSGASIFLNPVFRYDRSNKISTSFQVNPYLTNIKRVFGLLVFAIWIRMAFSFVFIINSRKVPVMKPLAFQ